MQRRVVVVRARGSQREQPDQSRRDVQRSRVDPRRRRARPVRAHTVHVELASSRPDGSYAPALQLAIPGGMPGELAELTLRAVRESETGAASRADRSLTKRPSQRRGGRQGAPGRRRTVRLDARPAREPGGRARNCQTATRPASDENQSVAENQSVDEHVLGRSPRRFHAFSKLSHHDAGSLPGACRRRARKDAATSRLIARRRDGNGVADDARPRSTARRRIGAPLPGELRDRFESSLGTDLHEGPRSHGAESAQAAGAVGARA